MRKFSLISRQRLDSCKKELQYLMEEVLKYYDISIICGHRTDEKQDEAFKNGVTKLRGGESKHNHNPSLAVDVCPYPFDFKNTPANLEALYYMNGIIRGIAWKMDIPIRLGADWNSNNDLRDQTFFDLYHIELI